MRELCLDLIVECRDPGRLQARDVVVQRVHEDRERQVPFQLGRRTGQDELPAPLRAGGQLPQQPRLADPRLPRQLDHARTAPAELSENLVDGPKFLGAPDQVHGKHGTFPQIQRKSIRVAGAEIRVPDQGGRPMSAPACRGSIRPMTGYLLHHRHQPHECGIVFASFKGSPSPLRHQAAFASCPSGGHEIWWTVEAEAETDAVRLLPFYVAQRTTVTPVSEIEIP
jgi:hypothetical protein